MVSADVQVQLTVNTSGQILGFNVPEDVYMRHYAEDFCEWVDGTIVKLPPIHDKHDELTRYLMILFNGYFELRAIGKQRRQPFIMRYEFEQDGKTKRRNREPDLQLILNENLDNLKPTYMDGAADIVIEVVSPESTSRNYGEKFHEYEQAGVPEYWIIDPIKEECRFYRLTAKKAYLLHEVEDTYSTSQLPKLILHIPTLWNDSMPGTISIGKMVQEMLEN